MGLQFSLLHYAGVVVERWRIKRRAALGTDAKSVGPTLSQGEREQCAHREREQCGRLAGASGWCQGSAGDEFFEFFLGQNGDTELFGLVELAAGLFAGDDEIGLLGDAPGGLAAVLVDQ